MQVTSGRVGYSRTVQPAQYESERAEVEVAFVVAEDEDPADAIAEAAAVAKEQALAVLGRKYLAKSDERASRRERFRGPRRDD